MNEDVNLEQVEQEIEVSIDAAKGAVEKKNQILTMIGTKEFKDVVEEGYFKDEASRLVMLLTDDEFQDEEKQNGLINDMIAIAGFRNYLATRMQIGAQMENQIAASQQELENLRNEGK